MTTIDTPSAAPAGVRATGHLHGEDLHEYPDHATVVQILIALSGLGFHYLNNRFTGAIVYGRDLMSSEAKAQRLAFNIDAILRIVCRPEALIALEKRT